MASQAVLSASSRSNKGSGHARRSRRAGKLPGIIYGSSSVPVMIEMDEHHLAQELRHHASENVMVDVALDGETPRRVLVKEIQHHPLSGRILHVDLQAVSMTETLKVSVMIELHGDPVGVITQGGVLEHLAREVEVECLPADIPERLVVDVTGLSIGDSLTFADLPLEAGKQTMVSDPSIAVAIVSAPRVADSETEDEEEELGAGSEPEVITEKKTEESGE